VRNRTMHIEGPMNYKNNPRDLTVHIPIWFDAPPDWSSVPGFLAPKSRPLQTQSGVLSDYSSEAQNSTS
jgi:hypothetical protein